MEINKVVEEILKLQQEIYYKPVNWDSVDEKPIDIQINEGKLDFLRDQLQDKARADDVPRTLLHIPEIGFDRYVEMFALPAEHGTVIFVRIKNGHQDWEIDRLYDFHDLHTRVLVEIRRFLTESIDIYYEARRDRKSTDHDVPWFYNPIPNLKLDDSKIECFLRHAEHLF